MLDEKQKKSIGRASAARSLPPRLRNSAIHRKYSLLGIINRDFAGDLYATAKRAGSKEIAVKVLKEGYALLSNTLGNIEHSRICQILHTIIEHNTIQAVVLERPEGTPLSDMIRSSGPLTPGQTVSSGLQLLSAIHAVHWNDATIGNLHSDSIFLSRDQQGNLELQLTNLGIGCVQDKLRETDYLAPEQIMGGRGGGRPSDIWAAGAIFYEMLTGKRPFKGENRYALAGEILLQEPDFSVIPKQAPGDLVAIVRKALDKDESRRYGDVAEMVSDLLPFQSEFNEPMSSAAEAAIKDSYPPERMGREPASRASRTAAMTSVAVPPAKVIPTVRISHTPSAPPPGISKKTGNLLRDDPGRVGKKTKLGMPAIALPAKRIPLKTRDETASFATAGTSGSPPEISPQTPRSRPPAAEAPAVAPDDRQPLQRVLTLLTGRVAATRDALKGGGLHLYQAMAASQGAATLLRRLEGMPPRKRLAVGVAGLFSAVLIIGVVIGTGGDDAPAAVEQPAVELADRARAEYLAAAAARPGSGLDQIEAPGKTVTAESAAKKVTITVKGAPKRARVRLNYESVDPPIVMDASDVPVAITVSARGYEPDTQVIIPSDDRTVEVALEKESRFRRAVRRRAPPRKARGKSSHGSENTKKVDENLASNPFGK